MKKEARLIKKSSPDGKKCCTLQPSESARREELKKIRDELLTLARRVAELEKAA